MTDEAIIVTCTCSTKETKMLYLLLVTFTTHCPLPHPHHGPAVRSKGEVLSSLAPNAKPPFLYCMKCVAACREAPKHNLPEVGGLATIQYSCWGDWIAKGTYISFHSRPEHHSSMKDNWWVKSPGSCRRVINGDRYTTWETGWKGKKIIYKRIVNSCTYC